MKDQIYITILRNIKIFIIICRYVPNELSKDTTLFYPIYERVGIICKQSMMKVVEMMLLESLVFFLN